MQESRATTPSEVEAPDRADEPLGNVPTEPGTKEGSSRSANNSSQIMIKVISNVKILT